MTKFFLLFLLFISLNIYALERVALVIGNANYQVNPLNNSLNDAKDLAASLEELGFDEVTLILDANKSEMEEAMRKFSLQMQVSDTSLFFFAGHASRTIEIMKNTTAPKVSSLFKDFTKLSITWPGLLVCPS